MASLLSRIVQALVVAIIVFYAFATLSLLLLRRVNPLTTAVQAERRIGSLIHRRTCRKVYAFVPMEQIFPDLHHAVAAPTVELASIPPAPLRRKPGRLTEYDRIISERMAQMGW